MCLCVPAFAAIDEYDNSEMSDADIEIPQYVDDTNINWTLFGSGYYKLDDSAKNHATGLNIGDWRAFYKDETNVLGTSTCNQYDAEDSFTAGQIRGPHCWCKIIATTKDIKKKTPTKWAYRGEFHNANECGSLCTYRCSYNFLGDPEFRGELFNK